jgi:hypothetical protein
MNRKGFAPVLIIGVIALVVIAAAVGWYFVAREHAATPTGIACTTEAKQCPDGSYVGRTGPDCAFAACPGVVATSTVDSTTVMASSTVNASGTISIVGTFATPNDVYTKTFTITNFSDVNIQTWSYGGGTNAAGEVIPAGGFDPAITLFKGSGPDATMYDSNDDGNCPPGHAPPPNYCLDATLNEIGLTPGTYTLALTVAPNVANGGTLGNAFVGEGSFTDPFDDLRTKNFAVDIAITPSTPTPISTTDAVSTAGWQVYSDPQFTISVPAGWPASVSLKSATSSPDAPSESVSFWVPDLPDPILEIMVYPHGFNSFQDYDEAPGYLGTNGTSDFYYDIPNGDIDPSVMSMLQQAITTFKAK